MTVEGNSFLALPFSRIILGCLFCILRFLWSDHKDRFQNLCFHGPQVPARFLLFSLRHSAAYKASERITLQYSLRFILTDICVVVYIIRFYVIYVFCNV